jgi:hypothetical protein
MPSSTLLGPRRQHFPKVRPWQRREKEEAITKKDRALAEKVAAFELEKGVEDRYEKLYNKNHHYKSKAKRLLKQVSFFPSIRDIGWALGFNWVSTISRL